MNTVIWIMQVFLAAFFILPGMGKIRNSKQQHIEDGHIKANASVIPIRVLGILELLGCVGIILPWLTNILPILTPITALCFCLIMMAGLFVHLKRKEHKMLPMLIIVATVSLAVAYYRFGF